MYDTSTGAAPANRIIGTKKCALRSIAEKEKRMTDPPTTLNKESSNRTPRKCPAISARCTRSKKCGCSKRSKATSPDLHNTPSSSCHSSFSLRFARVCILVARKIGWAVWAANKSKHHIATLRKPNSPELSPTCAWSTSSATTKRRTAGRRLSKTMQTKETQRLPGAIFQIIFPNRSRTI